MFKHISAINRREGQSVEEFRHYWVTRHAEIAKVSLPKLRKYLATFPALGAAWPGSGQHLVCDALVELHFDTLEDLQAAMTGPQFMTEERKASSALAMDLQRNSYMVGEEYVVTLRQAT
ncbi:MAG: EthD family reductase [Burkholderiaceae bacterium]|nr:EthD family reductase [Burkholderiaceae bacterium]MDO9088615.1 EthD family reductase [Burkholderiaceae bacterium]